MRLGSRRMREHRQSSCAAGTSGSSALSKRTVFLAALMALSITACSAEIRGALSRSAIRREIRLHRNELRGCYERELVRRPDAAGRVFVTFLIDADGWTRSVETASTELAIGRLEQCIEDRISRWRFPAVEAGSITRVRYGLRFAPSGRNRAQPSCYVASQEAAGMVLERRTRACDDAG